MIDGELEADELALLRTHPQRTDLYLAIPTYATIFTAVVVAQTPASNDGVYQVTFTSGSGAAFSSVEFWMTMLVGTLPGGSDIGIARIRKAITSGDGGVNGTIYIGTTSEIDFTAGQFLTVTNEFGLWPRHPYVDPVTGEEFMDYEIAYVEQHTYFPPIPNMFPSAVAKLPAGGTVSVEFNSQDSWSPYIPELSYPVDYSFVWTCTGPAAAVVVAPAAALTDITFSTVGTYLIKLVLTADYGGGHTAVASGYRYVIVYDDAYPLIKSPVLENCEGDYDSGGWSYRVTCHSQANLATIHNRTLCILVADDWYGTTHRSIGPITDRENIICIGWIDGESITWSNDLGNVSFDVQGPQWWFDRMEGYPTGVDDSLVDPAGITGWTMIKGLTARKGLWHFLLWRTTAVACMDIPSVAIHGTTGPDMRLLATTYTPAGTLWEQLRAIADRIFARATCDRYSRLFINVDMQLVATIGRPTTPNVMGLDGFTEADWRDEITIEWRTVPESASVDLSGIYWSGVTATSSALFALSPGHYFKHFGRPAARDRVALLTQAQANSLAGLLAGYLNNEYPNVDFPLSANNRAFDIAPYSFSWMSIAAGDTPREIEWTNKRLIPRRVSFRRDAGEAVLLTDATFEAETFASAAMIGDPPITPPPPPPPPPPPVLCTDPLALNFGGPAPCTYAPGVDLVLVMTAGHLGRSLNFFSGAATIWEDIGPRVGHAEVGYYLNLALNQASSVAWVLTTPVDNQDVANGLFYCADTSVAVPVWFLIYSQKNYYDAVKALHVTWTPGILTALALAGNGIVYAQATINSNERAGYITGDQMGIDYIEVGNLGCPPTVGYFTLENCGHQFSIYGLPVGARASLGFMGGSGAGAIIELIGVIPTQKWVSQNYSNNMYTVGPGNYVVNNVGNELNHYNDDECAQFNDMDLYSTDAKIGRPIITAEGRIFWTRNSDSALMMNVGVQALANTFGGVTGVFSDVDAVGGAYCNVNAYYSHIIWVAQTAHADNSRSDISYTEDGGGSWISKNGNWATAMGEAYEGGGDGGPGGVPMPAFASV